MTVKISEGNKGFLILVKMTLTMLVVIMLLNQECCWCWCDCEYVDGARGSNDVAVGMMGMVERWWWRRLFWWRTAQSTIWQYPVLNQLEQDKNWTKNHRLCFWVMSWLLFGSSRIQCIAALINCKLNTNFIEKVRASFYWACHLLTTTLFSAYLRRSVGFIKYVVTAHFSCARQRLRQTYFT